VPEPISKPSLYIIAGPNGAGKTTFARELLPDYVGCREFVNADLIAFGLSPFSPESAAIPAGRLMLARIRELARVRRDFGFETTLSGVTYLRMLREFKKQGYTIHLFYLWLDSVGLAVARVARRVQEGGHNVPEATIRRRFAKGLCNLFHCYRPLLDSWTIFDNSTDTPQFIATEEAGQMRIHNTLLFARISQAVDLE
jgi:predicted ABC-type ATPase